jgi:ribosome-binding factor A
VPDSARNIEELVARARVADAAVAAAREGAEPAGDPDPYRVRADSGDEPDHDLEADPDPGAGSGGPRGPLGDYPAADDSRARYSRRE